MPQVPDPQVPSVPAGGPATPYVRVDADPTKFGLQVGEATKRLAGAVEQGSDVANAAAIRFQTIKNQTEVDDTYNSKFSPAFREMYQKYYSLQGKDAVDQMPKYIKDMEALAKDTAEGMANPAQKRMFNQEARRRVQMELDGMARHADQENKVWMANTSNAALKVHLDQAADFYNDEDKFGKALGGGLGEIDRYAAKTGQSAEVARARANKFVSDAWTNRVQRMSYDDPLGARDLYRANVEKFEAQVRPQLEHQLKSLAEDVEARNLADGVLSGRPLAEPERLVPEMTKELEEAVIGKESAGKPDAVGRVTKSGEQARGLMQLMPSTAREMAKKLGIEYDEKLLTANTPEGKAYNIKLGRARMNEMLARYGGNQTLALAAYNAGPNRVDKWLVNVGNPNLGQISNEEFAAKIPFKETRDYVAKINARVPQKPGTMATSLDIRAHLGDWLVSGRSLAEELHPNDPVFRDKVESRIKSYVGNVSAAQEGVQRQNRAVLLTAVYGDGTNKPASLEQLLTTPELKAAWVGMDGFAQTAILQKLEVNAAKKQHEITPEAGAMYYKLKGLAHTDPDAFLAEDMTKHLKLMPDALWHELVQQQSAMGAKENRDAQKALNVQHALTIAKPALMAVGVYDPRAKSGSAKAAAFEQFAGRYTQQIDQFIANNKRRPNDKELQQITNSLLTTGAQVGSGWFKDTSVRAFQVPAAEFYVPVPKTERTKIVAEYTQARGHPPTDSQIQQLYTARQIQKGVK